MPGGSETINIFIDVSSSSGVAVLPRASLVYVAMHCIFGLLLSMNVGRARSQSGKVSAGFHNEIIYEQRAHGNFVEWATFFILALVGIDLLWAPHVLVHVFGSLFFFGRICHAFGILVDKSLNPPRTTKPKGYVTCSAEEEAGATTEAAVVEETAPPQPWEAPKPKINVLRTIGALLGATLWIAVLVCVFYYASLQY